jgi:hypothetical protein
MDTTLGPDSHCGPIGADLPTSVGPSQLCRLNNEARAVRLVLVDRVVIDVLREERGYWKQLDIFGAQGICALLVRVSVQSTPLTVFDGGIVFAKVNSFVGGSPCDGCSCSCS